MGPLGPGLTLPSLPRLLREQWIRAKYERLEFTHPEKQEPYSAGKTARVPLCLSLSLPVSVSLLPVRGAGRPNWSGPCPVLLTLSRAARCSDPTVTHSTAPTGLAPRGRGGHPKGDQVLVGGE